MATWGNTLIGQDDYVDNAYNRARAQWDAGKEAAIRQAGRMGINPNSGAFMNMLNQAQYEATAGANAAANAADMQWLTAAQDQFNKDRAAGMDQQRIDNQSNQWWAMMNAKQQALKAQYAHERGMFGLNKKYKNLKNGAASGGNQYNPNRPFDWEGYTYSLNNFPKWMRGYTYNQSQLNAQRPKVGLGLSGLVGRVGMNYGR